MSDTSLQMAMQLSLFKPIIDCILLYLDLGCYFIS